MLTGELSRDERLHSNPVPRPLWVRCNDYRNHSEMRKGVEYSTGETPVGEALGNR
ncbi:hypothetical protein [Bacillus phage SPO1L5]|nr:hypothetical protein Goe9_c01430 [Bacillus phage vB_BsuM-Goe9]WIT26672.1 hypothetical protein [Bacillus phage SPO1L5]